MIARSLFGLGMGILCLILTITDVSATQENVLLIVGDSLSAGYGIDSARSWPRLLQQRVHEYGYAYRIENASISGETSSGGARRLAKLLARHKPNLVVVELGANDGLRGIAIDELGRNLSKMLELINDAGATSLLFDMRVPPNYGPVYAARFEALYESFGERDNVILVPFFLDGVVLNRSLMQNDGLHPNADAQPIILDNVWDHIEDAIIRF